MFSVLADCRLINKVSRSGVYTGSGSCNCSGGGSATYSGCKNAGMSVFTDGVWTGEGSAMGRACADAACAAAGKGSCDLESIVQDTILTKIETKRDPNSKGI